MTTTKKNWPRSCLQIYTGHGKGKTTAALGLALRAAGTGLRVYFGQFLKSRDCGEVAALERFAGEITLERFGSGQWAHKGDAGEIALAQRGIEQVRAALLSGAYDLVVCDEILGALRLELLTLGQVLELARERPVQTELVFTGRDAPEELVQAADLVTEMREIKHYYATGLPARWGIEH